MRFGNFSYPCTSGGTGRFIGCFSNAVEEAANTEVLEGGGEAETLQEIKERTLFL